MSEEMKNAYKMLDINDKRNQLSDELLIIFELISRINKDSNTLESIYYSPRKSFC